MKEDAYIWRGYYQNHPIAFEGNSYAPEGTPLDEVIECTISYNEFKRHDKFILTNIEKL